ncbi:MAG: flavin-containing monooxygenase [Mycobacteriaceae bacterium]
MSLAQPGRPLDVLVIGGGQAGLAIGQQLAERGRRFAILDSGAEVGHVWRSRWDSLRLFTPGQYDDLPGMPFPAADDVYPGKDDVAAYLKAYAARFDLPVRLNATVTHLTRAAGMYQVTAGQETLQAEQVVIATGPFHAPFTPAVAAQLSPEVRQLHSSAYRRPDSIPQGRVLVVGAANSGCQIALELSATRSVELAAGNRIPTIPQRPLGRDVWFWAAALRLDRVTADSRLGGRLAGRDQVIGVGPRQLARRHGVRLHPRVTRASGRTVTFADGGAAEFDAVVWATGFVPDHSYVDIAGVVDERGALRQTRGITPSPGLYTGGQPWQHTRGSALLGWVGLDAAFVAEQIDSFRPTGVRVGAAG